MKRLIKSKIFLLLVLGILALDISNDFPLVDIKETAIVVALGVDKDGEEYELSAQIAVPQATS
ncbi:MAG: Ger(x)C family spore germination protein, partial [Clostridia bacterium]|nr:Ger(x)C family spore germination protein [Clostridia bacterium]